MTLVGQFLDTPVNSDKQKEVVWGCTLRLMRELKPPRGNLICKKIIAITVKKKCSYSVLIGMLQHRAEKGIKCQLF